MTSRLHRLSPRVKNLLPRFVRAYGPALVDFLEAYMEFLEESGGPIEVHHRTLEWHDIDETLDRFVDYFHNTFMPSIPKDVLADRRLLVKHIRDFYRTKGSQKSYKFLFRVLYNDDVEFYYPGRDILRASHGKWYIEKGLKLTLSMNLDDAQATIGTIVTGANSTATGRVESIKSYIEGGLEITECTLSNVKGTFTTDETIYSEEDAVVGIVSSYVVYPGRWVGQDGFISNFTKRLQGRDYYQEYSYVLKTGQPIALWEQAVRKLLHPAGTKMFNEVVWYALSDLDLIPDGGIEDTQFTLETISANVAPNFLTELGFTGTETEQTFAFELLIDLDTDMTSAYYVYSQLAGTAYVATSQNLAGYPGAASQYASWSPALIAAKRCVRATGSSYLSTVDPNDFVIIQDTALGQGNSQYTVTAIDSTSTMLLQEAYRYSPATSNAIIHLGALV